MDLSPTTVAALAEEYPSVQPLAAVEDEHLEVLPSTFSSGDYGWRDAEWVVQWYFRRFLGAYPDADRREAEAAYGENDYEDIHAAIADAVDADDLRTKLEALTRLQGVDHSIASAYLQFLEPSSSLVMSPVEWRGLREAGELEDRYPEHPAAEAYRRYVDACAAVADHSGGDLWTVYRVLWVCWYQRTSGGDSTEFE